VSCGTVARRGRRAGRPEQAAEPVDDGVAVAIGTVRAPGRLRRPMLWLARIVGGLMVLRASYGAAGDVAVLTGAIDGATRTASWDLLLWSPFFGAWGAMWLVAAGTPQPRSRLSTPSALRGANASQSLLK
jgi:hypothetical protein